MSKLLRHYSPGRVYFVTSVTHHRAPVLVKNFETFWEAVVRTQERMKFELIAWSILPDHFHMIIDPFDSDLSEILKRLKLSFAHQCRVHLGKKSGSVWQPRFWDHIIRDQNDLNAHIDYIHYNPVKHELIANPFDWRYSSLGEYFGNGYYASDWGVKKPLHFDGDFGE